MSVMNNSDLLCVDEVIFVLFKSGITISICNSIIYSNARI